MKMHFRLIHVANDHPVTKSSDPDFVHVIQQAALLGLKDWGYLDEVQYRYAEEALRTQKAGARKRKETGDSRDD